MRTGARSQRDARGATFVEIAIGIAVLGSVLAVAVPAFVRNLSSSRLVEPVNGLERIGASAVSYASVHPTNTAFPPSAPLTPAEVPRGVRVVDPQGTWDTPTWTALDFRFDDPHAFAFEFRATGATKTDRGSFVAFAHGDLDGDGVTSSFEIHGHAPLDARAPATIEPGMTISSELE